MAAAIASHRLLPLVSKFLFQVTCPTIPLHQCKVHDRLRPLGGIIRLGDVQSQTGVECGTVVEAEVELFHGWVTSAIEKTCSGSTTRCGRSPAITGVLQRSTLGGLVSQFCLQDTKDYAIKSWVSFLVMPV